MRGPCERPLLHFTYWDDDANVLFAACGDFCGYPEIRLHTVISAECSPETAVWEFFSHQMSTKYLCNCSHCLKSVHHSAADRFFNLSVSPGRRLCCLQAVFVCRSLFFRLSAKRCDITLDGLRCTVSLLLYILKMKNIVPLNISISCYLPLSLITLSGGALYVIFFISVSSDYLMFGRFFYVIGHVMPQTD